MSLFGDLIKNVVKEVAPDVDVEKLAKSAGDFVGTLASEGEKFVESLPKEEVSQASSNYAESGDSWGPEMPAEENQYNFNGSYLEYFTSIFETEFADYSFEREANDNDRPTTRFTFSQDGAKALVVELMPESSEAKKVRQLCAKEGTPYLRFYYDHDGWWNTRSYVVKRMKAALGA